MNEMRKDAAVGDMTVIVNDMEIQLMSFNKKE